MSPRGRWCIATLGVAALLLLLACLAFASRSPSRLRQIVTALLQPGVAHSITIPMSVLLPPQTQAHFQAAVTEVLSRPSRCVPDGGLWFTYANAFHAELMRLQLLSVQHEPCLVHRYLALCFGGRWHE